MRHTRTMSSAVSAREQHAVDRQRQLLADNKRLLKLLARTEEYQGMAHDVEDSKGGIAYVKASKKWAQSRSGGMFAGGTATGRKGGGVSEELQLWVPSEVSDAALDFRHRTGGLVPEAEISAFLRTANKSWRNREKAKLKRHKQRHKGELADLRRQLSQREPLVNVVHRVAGGYSVKPRTQGMGRAGADDVGGGFTDDDRRRLFLEGSVWFGYRTVEKLDKMGAEVSSVTQDYLREVEAGPGDIHATSSRCMKDIGAAALNCRGEIRQMFDEILQDDVYVEGNSDDDLSDESDFDRF
jgi:hypothetical protein